MRKYGRENGEYGEKVGPNEKRREVLGEGGESIEACEEQEEERKWTGKARE